LLFPLSPSLFVQQPAAGFFDLPLLFFLFDAQVLQSFPLGLKFLLTL
jgi:hypothetical protein